MAQFTFKCRIRRNHFDNRWRVVWVLDTDFRILTCTMPNYHAALRHTVRWQTRMIHDIGYRRMVIKSCRLEGFAKERGFY